MDVQQLRRLTGRRGLPIGGRVPVRLRLSLLMLIMYAAPGAVVPIFSLRLTELGFSPVMVGLCCATQAIGSMFAPLLAGQIADRWVPAERCLAVCAVAEAALLWLISTLTTPAGVFAASLAFWLVMAPAMTLTTAVTFANLPNPARDFGRVRLWGTVGWVLPMWAMGYWLSDAGVVQSLLAHLRPDQPRGALEDAFRLGSLLAALFGLYTLTLPRTAPRTSAGAAPLAAFRLLRGRAFFVYAVCTLGVCAVLPFSTQLTPLLLKRLGVPPTWLLPLLTVAQGSEVVSLAVLPAIMHRLGNRRTMRLGLLAAVLTLASLAIGRPLPLAVGGLGLYGLCISCYLVAGQMYLNKRARPDVRASSQAMHSVLCGVGLLVGNVLVGVVHRGFGGDFRASFAVAAGGALALLAFFVAGFPADPVTEPASSP